MNNLTFRNGPRTRLLIGAFALLAGCCVVSDTYAQFVPGQGFGNFGGGNTGSSSRSRSGSSGSSARSYPNNGVGDAIMSVDPETRSLVYIADEETSKYMAQVISNLDQPRPQVLIKVVFLEITHSDSSDIGIEGAYGHNIGNSTTGIVANAFGLSGLTSATGSNAPLVNAFGQQLSNFSPSPPGAGLYQIFAQDYQVTLRAIAQAGKAKVLSRPSIIARNNQPATISVGQSVPLVTSVRFDNFGNAINSINYQPVGIILKVTPFISPNGLVEMILAPETSDLVADRSQWVPISSGSSGTVSAPLINSRSADTVVVTPNGQTVIIGGLMQDSKAEAESKIPFLGDIPLIGNLFKRKAKNNSRTELMIFLTPYIIQAPSQIAAMTDAESEHAEIRKNLSEKELNQFLESLPSKALGPDGATRKDPRR
jgi:general secretion pathway protein D